MHDVGEAFHFHEPFDVDRARTGDAAQIVAAEVHQHDVFGPFLGVFPQFGGEAGVLQIVGPALARPGDGGKLELAFRAADHHFRGGAEEGDVRQVHEKHVGRGVAAPHPAVEGKGVALERHAEAAGRHHLNGLALAQHPLDFRNGGHIAFPSGPGEHVLFPDGRKRLRAFAGTRPAHLAVFAHADLAQAVVEMVEDQHRAGQDEARVGVFLGEAAFQLFVEEAGHAVAEIAVERPGDRRQIGAFRLFEVQSVHERAQAVHEGKPFQHPEGHQPFVVEGEGKPPVPAGGLKQKVARQNAVASPPSVDLRAFQQDAMMIAAHAKEQADGSVRIRREPPRALAQGDMGGGGRFGSCHVGNPSV